MITEEQMRKLFAQANPIPEPETIEFGEVRGTTYLATLEQRSSEVTKTVTDPNTDKKKANVSARWLAAAVLVILSGVVLIIMNRETPESGPIDQPVPTTTTIAPTSTAEQPEAALAGAAEMSVAESLVAARIAGDVDAAKSLVASSAILGFTSSLDFLELERGWREAVGWTIESDGCTFENPSMDNTQIDCVLLHETDISRALGIGPFPGTLNIAVRSGETTLGFFDDPVVFQAVDRFSDQVFNTDVWEPFVSWVGANYPDDLPIMFRSNSDGTPFLGNQFMTDQRYPNLIHGDSIELWSTRMAEYIAQFGS